MAKNRLKKSFFILMSFAVLLSVYFMPAKANTNLRCGATAMKDVSVTASLSDYGLRLNDVVYAAVKKNGILNEITPIKKANAQTREVLVAGSSLGIVMMTDGLVVTKATEVKNNDERRYPAADAGIRPGDVILEFNGVRIESADHIAELTKENGANQISIKYRRGNELRKADIKPALDSLSGEYKLGLLVKDSTSGIGTLTFVDPTNNAYGSLGHAITDAGTGIIMPVREGKVMSAVINKVIKGRQGTPGELQGSFSLRNSAGSVITNNEFGIYGKIENNDILNSTTLMPIGNRDCIRVGDAKILCAIDDSGPQYYDIKISKINSQNSQASKGLVIEVTDERLLEATGGIVQGMSGSPIIQNGTLVGAVTHVMINNPKKGYGVFIEWMLEETDKVA